MATFLAEAQLQVPAPLRIVLLSASRALSHEQISGVLDEVERWTVKMRAAREQDRTEGR
jgi:hypothetical protein